MTTIESRADWNARPWTSYTNLNWGQVSKFIVHINDSKQGARDQSPRSIQDFCMDEKGHSDVDYNELERDGVVYLGRGDHIGGHTLDNNSTSYGICVIYGGVFNDNDKTAVRDRYEYACGRAGRRLTMMGHRDAPGNVGQTDCPGDEIEAWVQAGMPYPVVNQGDNVTVVVHEEGQGWWYGDGNWWKPCQTEADVDAAVRAFGSVKQLAKGDQARLGIPPEEKPPTPPVDLTGATFIATGKFTHITPAPATT